MQIGDLLRHANLVYALPTAYHFQPLFAGSIGERHMKNGWRRGINREFTLTPIKGNGVGYSFVTKDSHSGQDCPKDRFRNRYLGCFWRLRAKQTNATLVGVPVELKALPSAQPQQIVYKPDNTTISGAERFLKSLQEWR